MENNLNKCSEAQTIELPLDLMEQQVLPDPDDVSYYVLEKERIIYLDFDVSYSVMRIQRMILRWNIEDNGIPAEQRKPIKIFIMSPGGELAYMWTLVDTMLLSATPVYTIDVGYAESAAALLFMAGERRFMFPNSIVMIHEGSAVMSGDSTKVLDASEGYKRELKKMKDFILSRTEIPKPQLNKKRNNDWELDAEKCMEFKVCTDVINSLSEVLV